MHAFISSPKDKTGNTAGGINFYNMKKIDWVTFVILMIFVMAIIYCYAIGKTKAAATALRFFQDVAAIYGIGVLMNRLSKKSW